MRTHIPNILILATVCVALFARVDSKAAETELGVRLGVISPANIRDVADLLTVELSRKDHLHIIERDAIDRLVSEAELTDVLGQGQYDRFAKILGADALILLARKDVEQDAVPLTARLVAVGSGAVIAWVTIPEHLKKPEACAKLVAERLAPFTGRIQVINDGRAVPVSLLGLRFEMESPGARLLERKINLMAALSLGRSAEVVVLERWDLKKLAWEKSLASNSETSFWAGSTLIDGRITREKDDRLQVNVRLRSGSNEKETWLNIRGSEEDIPQFVESVSESILRALGTSPGQGVFSLKKEANNYAILGQWALNQGLLADGVSALETAIALGYEGRVGRMRLVHAYMRYAGTRGTKNTMSKYRFKNERIGEVVQITTDALDQLYWVLGTLNRDGYEEPEGLEWNEMEMRAQTLMNLFEVVRNVLRSAYDSGYYEEHAQETARLRRRLRECAQRGLTERWKKLDYEHNKEFVPLAPYWTDTPEETLRIYREALLEESLLSPHLRFHFSLKENSPSPWLIAWDPRDADRLPGLWNEFLEELLNSSDPARIADGYLLKYLDLKSIEERHGMLPEVFAFIKQHADKLQDRNVQPYLEGFRCLIESAFYAPVSDELRRARFDLCREIVQNWDYFHCLTLSMPNTTGCRKKDLWTPEEAAELCAIIDQRLAAITSEGRPGTHLLLVDLTQYRGSIVGLARHLAPQPPRPPHPDALKVSRTLSFALSEDRSIKLRNMRFTPESKIWATDVDMNRIYIMDPLTGRQESVGAPPGWTTDGVQPPQGVTVNVADTYVFVVYSHNVWQYTRKTKVWERLDVPEKSFRSRYLDGRLYLFYDGVDHGLLRIDPETHESELLISTRRTPPKSTMDSAGFGNFCDLVLGSQNHLTVFADAGLYECVDGTNTWRGVLGIGGKYNNRLEQGSEGPVLYSTYTYRDIFSFSHAAEVPELLLTDSRFTYKFGEGTSRARARWILPDALKRRASRRNIGAAKMHEGTLWIISHDAKLYSTPTDKTPAAMLHVFRKDEREGSSIPLYFSWPDERTEDGAEVKGKKKRGQPSINKILVVKDGLALLSGLSQPAWYIPFSEIQSLR